MKTFFSELFERLFSPLAFGVTAFIVLLMGVMGPFGTFYSMTPIERMVYWAEIIFASVSLVHIIDLIYLQTWRRKNDLAHNVVVAAVFSVIFAPLLWHFGPFLSDSSPPRVIGLPALMLLCFGCVSGAAFIRSAVVQQGEMDRPKLLERIGQSQATTISRVTVRDHLLDVYTDAGVQTLRLRFGDAISELDGLEGMQVHRSHWVARAAVRQLVRERGRVFIEMQDGEMVPVSRGFQADAARFVDGPQL